MNILVLGGRSKTGLALVSYFKELGHTVLGVGRPQVDFQYGWVTPLHGLVTTAFGDTNLDLIVVNVYDHSADNGDIQGRVAQVMWNLFKDKDTTLAAIGCLEKASVRLEKKALAAQMKTFSKTPSKARIVMVNPTRLTEVSESLFDTYLTAEDLGRALLSCYEMRAKYVSLDLHGSTPCPLPNYEVVTP